MSANPEFSRRQLLKAAAGSTTLAFVPFLGERGRTTAQEATPQTTETVVIPRSETPEDDIEGFITLVTKNMRPEALEHLGLAPLLTQEELKKQQELGTFLNFKLKPQSNITFLDYRLDFPDTYTFYAGYRYNDTECNSLQENILFVRDVNQQLRQNGDTTCLPYDKLKLDAYFLFNLPPCSPPDGMNWKDYTDIAPYGPKDYGIIGRWKGKDTSLVESIFLDLYTDGLVGFTRAKGKPQATQ